MRIFYAATIALSGLAISAQAPITFSSTVQAALSDFKSGNYLKANDTLTSLAFGPDGKVSNQMAFALWKQFSPFLTNELELSKSFSSARPSPSTSEWVKRISISTPREAIDDIVARARKTNIVILNEAHSSPRDRAFALLVARALRPLGYKTLAAETFENNEPMTGPSAMERLRQDGFVRFSTGVYTKDPVFARFVREALALGYKPVAYEQTTAQTRPTDGIPEREQAQAENLLKAIFRANPSEKVLIYVGQGHVAEIPGKHGEMMAARLKRLTGVDPLTIDQASVTDIDASTSETYAAASARVGEKPAIFYEGKSPLLMGPIAGVDVQVIHPRRSYESGRPAWLTKLGGDAKFIQPRTGPNRGRRLVQVFAADAPSDAVPLDQILISGAASKAPPLIVPRGPTRFAIQE